ncbi:MAG: hypothetical protein ACREQY_18275, partial [Candidatus Binatia bacterium]
VASKRNLFERVLHIRNEAFRSLEGGSPQFTIDAVTDITDPNNPAARRVEGTLTVPNFLSLPGGPTGSTFNYVGTPDGNLPARFPGEGTLTAGFTCHIPKPSFGVDAPDLPALYGHGLLGSSRSEGSSGHVRTMGNLGNLVFCATDWIGMSEGDLATVATIIADLSNFPKLADRSQQGFVNFMFLGRAMIHPEGFCSHDAFRSGSDCLIDATKQQVYYDGNSQGAIMGGSLVAVAHDVRRGVLGVPGMNYSTLLNRSVDWEGAYAIPFYLAYPDKIDQQIAFALMQMLWDRAESNGYAHHMSTDPYDDPSAEDDSFHDGKTVESAKGAKQILLHVAFADHQVANLAAEVEARTIGARIIETSLDATEHWEDAPFFALEPIPAAELDPLGAGAAGSAIVYWHNGNNPPPNENVPPDEVCKDPHESPRRDPEAIEQKRRFYHDRKIFDTCGSVQCETSHNRNCVDGQPIGG